MIVSGFGLVPSREPEDRRQNAWASYIQRGIIQEEAALAALSDESSSLVYTVALRILQDAADAAEVVVDVYR